MSKQTSYLLKLSFTDQYYKAQAQYLYHRVDNIYISSMCDQRYHLWGILNIIILLSFRLAWRSLIWIAGICPRIMCILFQNDVDDSLITARIAHSSSLSTTGLSHDASTGSYDCLTDIYSTTTHHCISLSRSSRIRHG